MAMRERHKALVRLFWRRLGMMMLVLLVILAGLALWRVYQKERDSRELRRQAEVKLADLKEQETSLSTHIQSLRTERGKEEALREQYSVGREGEGLIVIVEPEQPEPVQATSSMRLWVKKFLPFW